MISGNKINPLKVQIADVCRIGNGYAFKSPEYRDNGIPLLRISNIANERVTFDKGTIYLDENCLVTHKDFVVNKGDVLIALSGATTGKYGIYELEGPCLLNQRIGIIRSGNSKSLDSKYFYFYLSELRSEILRKAQGAAQPNISTKEIGQFKIPLPPLAEQQKIASILDAADSLRQKDQQLIEKYTALSQSLFLEMFGDPVSNPKKWAIKAFGNSLIDIVGGKSVGGEQRQIKDNEKAVLKISAVTTGIFNSLEYKVVEDFEVPDILVHPLKGDLLFSRANTRELVGATCIVDEDYEYLFLPDKLWRLDLKLEMVCNWYLRFLLTHDGFRENLRKVATGTSGSMLNISKAKLKQLKILLPPIELQNQFAERIQLIEAQKKQAQASLEKSAALFNSLLQLAFKGELTA